MARPASTTFNDESDKNKRKSPQKIVRADRSSQQQQTSTLPEAADVAADITELAVDVASYRKSAGAASKSVFGGGTSSGSGAGRGWNETAPLAEKPLDADDLAKAATPAVANDIMAEAPIAETTETLAAPDSSLLEGFSEAFSNAVTGTTEIASGAAELTSNAAGAALEVAGNAAGAVAEAAGTVVEVIGDVLGSLSP